MEFPQQQQQQQQEEEEEEGEEDRQQQQEEEQHQRQQQQQQPKNKTDPRIMWHPMPLGPTILGMVEIPSMRMGNLGIVYGIG